MSGLAPSWIVAAVIAGAMVFGGFLWMTGRADDPKANPASPVSTPLTVPGDSSAPAPLPFAEAQDAVPLPLADSEELAGETDEDVLVASLTEKVRSDPTAAARMVEAMPAGELRVAAMRTVFREWAAIAPHDALAWTESIRSEEDQLAAREFVHYRVAEDDPKFALESARDLGADLSMPVVQDLAQQWAARNPPAARDWALSLPAGTDRDRILSRVAIELSQQDPAAAGAIVAGEISPGSVQEEAAMSVLHQWAVRDFRGASQWVVAFPPGPMRERAEEELRGIRDHLP